MFREEYDKYNKREKKKWEKLPEPKPSIWYRHNNGTTWYIKEKVKWNQAFIYIIDDEFAKLKKQFLDDRNQIEFFSERDKEWRPTEIRNILNFTANLELQPSNYRIMNETKPTERIEIEGLPVKFSK